MALPSGMDGCLSESIPGYRRLEHRLATGGRVTDRHIAVLAAAGFEVVVNLLPDDAEDAWPGEGEVVRSLGMRYFAIPIVWERPSLANLRLFSACMAAQAGRKIFVHCAKNYRVSVFVALDRILRLGWQTERALREAARVWKPDAVWRDFIARALKTRTRRPQHRRVGRLRRAHHEEDRP
ncbi:MAG: protein tyrosine phosphatase family protein [Candidatus Eisenbacteria bacterium]|nr:protein tyrosine phosphatase family protein [Candidatus Eisenbacteria bacterium]